MEFGYKAQVVDNEDGIVLDYTVEQGNPADAPQLAPAIDRIKHRTGDATARGHRRPRLWRSRRSTTTCTTSASATVVIPRKGKPGSGPTASRNIDEPFRRTGQVAHRIRRHGSATSSAATDGTAPASTAPTEPGSGCGHGVLAHNLVKIQRTDRLNRPDRGPRRSRLTAHRHPSPATDFFRGK